MSLAAHRVRVPLPRRVQGLAQPNVINLRLAAGGKLRSNVTRQKAGQDKNLLPKQKSWGFQLARDVTASWNLAEGVETTPNILRLRHSLSILRTLISKLVRNRFTEVHQSNSSLDMLLTEHAQC
ncbi:unnamed protein product [Caretta caretta]